MYSLLDEDDIGEHEEDAYEVDDLVERFDNI